MLRYAGPLMALSLGLGILLTISAEVFASGNYWARIRPNDAPVAGRFTMYAYMLDSLDEALGLPGDHASKIALRTQQVILEESGVAETADPLGGSYLIESLTDQIDERVTAMIARSTVHPASSWPRWRSIMSMLDIEASGLITPFPVYFGADPPIGSNIDTPPGSGLRLPPAAMPMPP